MPQRLALTTILVSDYNEAIAFYVGKLGLELLEDTQLTAEKRWVVVSPSGSAGGLLLTRAVGDRQHRAVGDQSGGRVFLFLETDDLSRDHATYTERGIKFLDQPRREAYARLQSSRMSTATGGTSSSLP